MITCEALFALPHKASFDAGQWNRRFAADKKKHNDYLGVEIMSFMFPDHGASRSLSRRTIRSSGHHALKSIETQRPAVRDAAHLQR